MRENDQLDLLIDAALATYSEPPAGVEDRVLQALISEGEASATMPPFASPRRRWLPWAIALPLAASALLALFIQLREPHHATLARIPSSPLPSHISSPVSVIAGAKTPEPISHRAGRGMSPAAPEHQVATPPKLDVFPTPEPLTREEMALSVYSGRTPKPELEALARAQTPDEKPFPIATSHFPPLQKPDEDKN